MKIVMLLSVLFISGSVFAQTYRSGGTRKANFGAQQTQQSGEEGEKSSVPGASSGVKTRTFTSYGARRQWSKGVQTQTVQTSTAGTAAVQDPSGDVALPGAEQKLGAAAKKASPAPKAAAAETAAPAAPAAAAPAVPAEAAAAMQQVQGLQDMLKGLGGAAGAGAPAGAAGASAGAAPAMPAGMNIPGMPDMSALMGAAAAGQQPGKK